jgi:hypothetical protein
MKNEANDFFAKEYLLNYILGTYKKIHVSTPVMKFDID